MTDELTQEQLEAGASVAAAGVAAGEAEADPARRSEAVRSAVRREADRVQIALSDEDCEKLAGAIIAQLDMRGAFDPPPEPVAPPPAEPAAEPAPPADAQPPRPQSFAERFRSR